MTNSPEDKPSGENTNEPCNHCGHTNDQSMSEPKEPAKASADSWSLGIILKHGIGDWAFRSDESPIELPFNIEECCRELDSAYSALLERLENCQKKNKLVQSQRANNLKGLMPYKDEAARLRTELKAALAEVERLQSDIAILKTEKASLMRQLSKFTGNS